MPNLGLCDRVLDPAQLQELNSVSSQCTHGKSCCAKTGSPFQKFLTVKNFLKCNPSDFKFFLGKLNNKKFPHMV